MFRGDAPARARADEILASTTRGAEQLRPGTRHTIVPIRAALRRFSGVLRRHHARVLALRSDAATAAAWMDWYLDNEYLIRRVLVSLHRDLSTEFASRLPRLSDGERVGGARVAVLARVGLERTEYRFDPNVVEGMVLERLPSAPLNTAELWALPLLLRHESLGMVFGAVERLLAGVSSGMRADDEAGAVSDGALVANAIRSLHRLEKTDWSGFFERVSVVERLLSNDPAGIYPAMDFATRDAYRAEVERLARLAAVDETTVAEAAVALARHGATIPEKRERPASDHVGFYLVDRGRDALERRLGHRPSLAVRLARGFGRQRQRFYLAALAATALVFVAPPVLYALYSGGVAQGAFTVLLVLVPAATIASVVVNWLITLMLPPRVLPRLDFLGGIPPDHRAAVCICALVGNAGDIARLLRQVERHYLAGSDAQLRFGLLTGLFDSPTATTPRDGPLLEALREGIEGLNHRYGEAGRQPFFWLHRRRVLEVHDGIWMEWERKRGKLQEFNRFLLEGDRGTFDDEAGAVSDLRGTPYVVTLDVDTVLPVDAARRLVGTIAHPLNRPLCDPDTGAVVSGYSILQPRVEIDPVTAVRNLFTRAFSGDRGLDVYSLAVSDAYQDLFAEGIYTGKGLYDVAAFEASLQDAVPEGAVLSHDLFEGIHGRAALVSDVVVYEDYPVDYLAYVRRLHRWVRGDWQLLPWLASRVPTASGGWRRNRLEALDRWQILHNLLRSLQAPVLVVLLLLGWFTLPGSALHWTVLALLTLLVPALTGVVGMARRSLRRRRATPVFRELGADLRRWLLAVTFLPHEAWVVADAACRAVYRSYASRRRLLEWTPAAVDSDAAAGAQTSRYWRAMWRSPAFALALAGALALWRPASLPFAVPVLMLWLASPQIALLVRRERAVSPERVRADDRTRLRRLARRTWLFFERFVGPEDHWLPPDHFQESPRGVVAHRTSPTNIGLLLLSNVAAYDLGYVDAQELLVRSRNTLDTIQSMRRFRGHLLNWYDTHHLAMLPPAYVSTVDSGNLLGCLLALKQAAAGISADSLDRDASLQGLLDTVGVLGDCVAQAAPGALSERLEAELRRMRAMALDACDRDRARPEVLDELSAIVRDRVDPAVQALVADPAGLPPEALAEIRVWLERTHHHMSRLTRSRHRFLGWGPVLAAVPAQLGSDDAPESVAAALQRLRALLEPAASPGDIHQLPIRIQPALDGLRTALAESFTGAVVTSGLAWIQRLETRVLESAAAAGELLSLAEAVADTCECLFRDTEMAFLYDPARRVFHIGYDVDRGQLDDNAYDLLASESRLASLLAIAKGDVPAHHWAHLGRPLTRDGPDVLLLSWSGTLFEYLMPGLLMPEPRTSLLGRSAEGAIASQMRFAASRELPWGISESGYYALDAARNYGYRAFGVPRLALQASRGVEDLVIAPYATFLALPWRPRDAADNLHRLEALGMLGRYGFFEAVDFTPRRLEVGQASAIVRSYMAHHQGMSLVSVANALTACNAMSRFSAEPRVMACELLLQERTPTDPDLEFPAPSPSMPPRRAMDRIPALPPWDVAIDTPTPRLHLLSNGRYGVLAANDGGGGSFWKGRAVTRWRPDATVSDHGCWLYVRDADSGDVWSITRRPVGRAGGTEARVLFHPHAVEYRRRDPGLVQSLEVTVCARDDVELRRISLTNHGDRPRRLALTSYAEVVLGDAAADRQHPAFSGLFVHSDFDRARSLLLLERRSREGGEQTPVMAEFLVGMHGVLAPDAYETDRGVFLGRGGGADRPEGLNPLGAGSLGDVLDPIASLTRIVTIEPHSTERLAFVRIVASSREALLRIRERFLYWANVQYAFDEARTRITRDLHRSGISPAGLRDIAGLTSALLCPHPALRAPPDVLARNRLGQPGLWGMGISGDHPILLVKLAPDADMGVVTSLLKAHEFWRKRELSVDLVFLDSANDGYLGNTRDALERAIALQHAERWIGRRGGLFVLADAGTESDDAILLHAAAAVVVAAVPGGIGTALRLLDRADIPLPRLPLSRASDPVEDADDTLAGPSDLSFDNGFGGFGAGGREYVMSVTGLARPPAPWINVMANPDFGCLVSESGGGYTWWLNSGENRLTPWRNDAVVDAPAECLYLRDEETGEVWCPTPAPIRDQSRYLVRHGAGYSRFEHRRHGIDTDLTLFVDATRPVKCFRLNLENHSGRPRRLTVTLYVEWVVGTRREADAAFIIPTWNGEHRALLARNPHAAQCPDQVAFVATDRAVHGFTADRGEFLGRTGGYAAPAALSRVGLSGRVEAGRDPCAALQVHVDLPSTGRELVTFVLGAERDAESALSLIRDSVGPDAVARARERVDAYWEARLGAVTLTSPDAATDMLFNRWLLYQALSSRLHGRTGLYQSSGAYGFRDQLQDATALLAVAPEFCRAQILRAAARQFPEGDVLHWWHPPEARGVRTRISDDLLWLPWVVCEYLAVTDDADVLDESVPWLVGEPLDDQEADRYSEYRQSADHASVYAHCLRAIRRADRCGGHGLPLMGAGDWNDGFSRVGAAGRGESVWLGWFLLDVLRRFAPVCEARGDSASARVLAKRASELASALASSAWDGRWYRRAYHDDGTPLGAADRASCRIDAIAQSWAVLSGGDGSGHEREAMAAVAEHLLRVDDGLVLLFEPPFFPGGQDVGYIGAYPPGVRENGGQYTHAAAWTGLAFARLGDSERVAAVLRALNPVNHALTEAAARHYRVEPYVVAADVYGHPPHVGRGGWTWYTGSAGWLYRFILEGVLGIRRRGDVLEVGPCLPPDWPGATVVWRHAGTRHRIELVRREAAPADALEAPCRIKLHDDGAEHLTTVIVDATGGSRDAVARRADSAGGHRRRDRQDTP